MINSNQELEKNQNSLIDFDFEGNHVRTIKINGEPWLVAKDVCGVLALDRTQTRRLDEDEKGVCSLHTLGGIQKLLIINESGLYSLILKSIKPEAKKFKRWITHDVLPSIRKTGKYEIPVDARIKSKETRNHLTKTWQEHGASKRHHFMQLTWSMKDGLKISRKKKKANYDIDELQMTTAAEMIADIRTRRSTAHGYHELKPIAHGSAERVRIAVNEPMQIGVPQ